MARLLKHLNVISECHESRIELWHCPPFLFIIMGLTTIASMVATYILASQKFADEPEIAALIVIFVAFLFLIVGNLIIEGFNKIAEANRMKSDFISIASHQLRSPLSIFKWTLDAMEHEEASGRDRQDKTNFMQTLHNTAENMIKIVNALLEVSRIEAGTVSVKKESFSLSELTEEVLKNFYKYAAASNITLTFEPQGNLPLITTDRDRVAMVLQNFIDNAVRYTRGSGNILITLSQEDNYLKWTIKDRGIGIPIKQQKYIFQKFFRADNVYTQQTRGAGIGLYIAKAIVEVLGGKIGFASKEGEGSTFWFTLPLK